jgi:hypothetical protein
MATPAAALTALIPPGIDEMSRALYTALISRISTNGALTQEDVRNQLIALTTTLGLDTPTDVSVENAQPPTKPVNLTASGAFTTIIIDWAKPTYAGHAFAEVYRAKNNSVGEALANGLHTYVRGNVASDAVASGSSWWYFVRFVNLKAEAGQFSSAYGETSVPAIELIEALEGQLSETELVQTLQSRINLIDGPVGLTGSVSARIATEAQTRVDGDTAVAQQVTQLRTDTPGLATNAVEQKLLTRTIAQDLYAQYTVKIDQNNHVSGFGLASTTTNGQTVSAFIIAADKFAVMDPTVTDSLTTTPSPAKMPFIVNNGTTYIKDAAIQDAAITNAKIANATIESAKIASLSAAKITSGYIDAARINTGSIDATKLTVSNLAAISANLGSVTAGTLTGATIRTAATGSRLELDTANGLRAFSGTTQRALLATDGSGWFGDSTKFSWTSTGVVSINGTVITGQVATAVVPSLPADKITSGVFGDGLIPSLNASKITAGTLGVGVIYAGTINADKINAGTLGVNVLYSGSINASKINAGTLGVGVLYSGSIAADKITAGAISVASGSFSIKNASGTAMFSIASGGEEVSYYKLTGGGIVCSNATNTAASAVYATSLGSEPAVHGEGGTGIGVTGKAGSGAGSHGVRGRNDTAAVHTAGIIGTAAGFDFLADGNGVNYGPFTGAHEGLLPLGTIVAPGDILIGTPLVFKSYSVSNSIAEVIVSFAPCQKAAIGVFVLSNGIVRDAFTPVALYQQPEAYYEVKDRYEAIAFNAVGEGQLSVCGEGGDLEIGDLIVTSSIPGKGMKQADDVIRNYTVAKCREVVVFDSPTQVKLVACIYLCG